MSTTVYKISKDQNKTQLFFKQTLQTLIFSAHPFFKQTLQTLIFSAHPFFKQTLQTLIFSAHP
jgi:hypothetical protein